MTLSIIRQGGGFTLLRGPTGRAGLAAWTPILAVDYVSGQEAYFQVTDWVGGQGSKPATGFIGPTGLLPTIVGAVNFMQDGAAIHADRLAADDDALLAAAYATLNTAFANATDNSARSWAIGGTGTGQPAAGDAKSWATKTGATVDGTDNSAKEWSIGVTMRGVAGGGSAKDWATYMGGTVDGTGFSAQYWAGQAQTYAFAVSYIAQTLTAPQQAQARTNIDALTTNGGVMSVTGTLAGNNGTLDFTQGSGPVTTLRVSVATGYLLGSTRTVGWASGTSATGSLDTGLSRGAAGQVNVGNGTQGDASGSLSLASITLGNNLSLSVGGSATTSALKWGTDVAVWASSLNNFTLNIGAPGATAPGFAFVVNKNTGAYQQQMKSTTVQAWSASDIGTGAMDTGLSRISAGVVGVGNGAQGDFSGTLKLAKLITGDATNNLSINQNATTVQFNGSAGAVFRLWPGGDALELHSGDVRLPNATLGWSIGFGNAPDLILRRAAAANLALGAADAAAPAAQTISVQNVVAGTLNTAGTNLTINGSQGTGTALGGDILFQTAPAGTLSGTTVNSLVTMLRIKADAASQDTSALLINHDGNGPRVGSSNSNMGFFTSNGSQMYLSGTAVVLGTSRLTFGAGYAASDTGISRTAAGALAIGNGTAGDGSGQLSLGDTLTFNSAVANFASIMERTTFLIGGNVTGAVVNPNLGFSSSATAGTADTWLSRAASGSLKLGTTVSGTDGTLTLSSVAYPGGASLAQATIIGVVNSVKLSSPGYVMLSGTQFAFSTDGSTRNVVWLQPGVSFGMVSNLGLTWTNSTTNAAGTSDTGIFRSAAGVVAIGNGTAGDASGTLKLGVLKAGPFTVATLPSASASGAGAQTVVSDCANPTSVGSAVTGGGTAPKGVISNGTTWLVD